MSRRIHYLLFFLFLINLNSCKKEENIVKRYDKTLLSKSSTSGELNKREFNNIESNFDEYPIIIYEPIGCNFPSNLGNVFAIQNKWYKFPYPKIVFNPAFIVKHTTSNFFKVLPATPNLYEWEGYSKTTNWPLGNYTVSFRPNSNSNQFVGYFSFTLIPQLSNNAFCW